jgi:hypothetical protein
LAKGQPITENLIIRPVSISRTLASPQPERWPAR